MAGLSLSYIFHLSLESNQNGDVLDRVSSILKGFFRVVSLNSDSESLTLYTDDRESPLTYSGDLEADKIVAWVLVHLDEVIAERAKEAASLKAFQEFQEKETERANKEWKD